MIVKHCSLHWRLLHDRYNVCIVTSAATDWRYGGKDYFVRDDDIMFMEPGNTHVHMSMLKPADFKVVLFDDAIFENASQELEVLGTPHFRAALDRDPSLFGSFERLHAAIETGESVLEQQSRFAHCLQSLLTGHLERTPAIQKESDKNPVGVLRAEAYLREHFDKPISLEQLSAVAGLSRFHLLRTFAKHFGIPPHTYQNVLRLSHARSLLGEGAAVAAAAAMTGFADQSHMTRHYKKMLGMTPTRYVEMLQPQKIQPR